MKKIIVNADDFGYSTAVNLGIVESYKNGVLTSTTLMANMPGCDEAIELAKKNPGLGVGGHLVLTCGIPMTTGKTLINENGKFFNLKEYETHRNMMDEDEIFNEWSCQIDYLKEKGVKLTHLDSHHHVHTFPENHKITKKIAEKYQLCFRNAYELEEELALPCQKGISGFLDLMDHPEIRNLDFTVNERHVECFEEIQSVLDLVRDNEVTELMVHPAFVDEALYSNSSFNVQRTKEVTLLCDPLMREIFEERNMECCHYGNLVTLVNK